MLPTSEHVRRQCTIDIASAQDDNIIDAALAALLLHAISQDLDAVREEAAREARRLHFHVFNAPKKQCVRRVIQTPKFAPWNYFENNNNGSDQSWFHCFGLSKIHLNPWWVCARSPGVATQLLTLMACHVYRESLDPRLWQQDFWIVRQQWLCPSNTSRPPTAVTRLPRCLVSLSPESANIFHLLFQLCFMCLERTNTQ
jgi:hypothetical protein